MNRTPLLIVAVLATTAILVPTGAVPFNPLGTDEVPDAAIELAPVEGGNGEYAILNEDDNVELLLTDENPYVDGSGVPSNAVTPLDHVFTITYTGEEYAEVWITDDADAIRFFRGTTPARSIEGRENNVTLAPDETVAVGIVVDTRNGNDVADADTFSVEARVAEPTDQSTPTPVPTDPEPPEPPEPTPTETPTPTPTDTPTQTPPDTPTPTDTPTQTPPDTPTPTDTPTQTPPDTPTQTPPDTPASTETPTPTSTDTPTSTGTPTPTSTDTPTSTGTPTPAPPNTSTPTGTPTQTPTSAPTDTSTPTDTPAEPPSTTTSSGTETTATGLDSDGGPIELGGVTVSTVVGVFLVLLAMIAVLVALWRYR